MDSRPGRGLALAPLEASFAVFAQARDSSVDIDTWNRHAERFFKTRVGLTQERRGPATSVDLVSFVIAPADDPPAVRRAFARPAQEDDYARAEAAEAAMTGTGLAKLARRCGMLWLVEREDDGEAVAAAAAAAAAAGAAAAGAATVGGAATVRGATVRGATVRGATVPGATASEPTGDATPDRAALLLAAILASILLGPILDGRAGELFGVKTARAKLEAR